MQSANIPGDVDDRSIRVTYVGHATVLLKSAGGRVLTDPVLTDRLLHLRRRSASVESAPDNLDCVLISHLHHDHLHPASLRRLSSGVTVIVPAGGGRLLRRAGIRDIYEISVGDSVDIAGVTVEAVPARHGGRRAPGGPSAEAVGFIVSSVGQRIYFAGDTDLFPEMSDLGDLDIALVPVWGWGTSLGEGHLNPARAADALRLLRPRVAIPIHWGTFLPVGTLRRHHHLLREPPREFAARAAECAPNVAVRIVEPGDSTVVAPKSAAASS